MLRHRLAAFAAFAGVAIGGAGAARGEPSRSSSLSWSRLPGAESCIATRDLGRAIEERLGHRVFVSASHAELAVEGRVERVSQAGRRGWRATIAVTREDGTVVGRRELHVAASDCSLLDDSLVLAVALMIDPTGGAEPAPERPATAPSEPRVIVIEVPVPAPAPRWSGDAAVSAFGLAAGTGAIVPGLRITASALPPGLVPLEIRGDVSALAHAAGDAVALRFVYGGVALCPAIVGDPSSAARLVACGGIDAGVVHANARGGERDDVVCAGSARGRVVVPLFRGASWSFDVRVEAELLAFLRRPSYSATTLDAGALATRDVALYQVPMWGGTAAIGFGVELR